MKRKVLSLFIFSLFLIYQADAFSSSDITSTTQDGVIDLRQQSFSENIKLEGKWHFFWKKLVPPQQTTLTGSKIIDFPQRWNTEINGETQPDYGYATYRVKVLLPQLSQPLSIAMPPTYCAYSLYLNDSLVASDGKVATNPDDFIPHWKHNQIDIPLHTDTMVITLQIANFTHRKGGIIDSPVIGKTENIELKRRRTEAIDLLLTGCLIMGGLFFLGLYLLGSRDKAILLFSLYSIIYSYRIIGIEHYVLHSILPDLSWYLTIRLEYITLFLGIGLFAIYTRYLYWKDINKFIINTIVAICFIFTGITLVVKPIYFSHLVNPFLIVCLFSLTYTPYVYLVAFKKKRPGSIYTLASSLSLMVIFALSLFSYWRIIQPQQFLSFLCYISFFFLQSLALSHRVSFVLKKAKRLAEDSLNAKSEFLSTMSHEIRTPLNSVIGMTHLLLKNNPRKDQREQLDVMLFSANNLLSIVNDILDYNKIEAGKISFEHIEMDVAVLAKNLISGLQSAAEDKGIELRLTIDKNLKTKLLGDPTRLYQIINNLVHNAIKFTSKGYVELGIKVINQTTEDITLNIYVKDSGIGISKEKQKLIFERFTQADSTTSRSFGGTGLGLAICKRILELQNSVLELESEEGKGSVFYFTQTFEKSHTKSDNFPLTEPAEEKTKSLNGTHILLVEDNLMNVFVAKTFLEKWGAIVDVASNGEESLQKLDVHKHKIILMDLHMPVMDGYEATRRMRDSGVTLPIIALTASIPSENDDKLKAVNIDDIVIKPFHPEDLHRKILNYL